MKGLAEKSSQISINRAAFAQNFLAPSQNRIEEAMLGYISTDAMANIVKTSIKIWKKRLPKHLSMK